MLNRVAAGTLGLAVMAVPIELRAQRAMGGAAAGQQAQTLEASGRAATAVCFSNQCRLTDTSTLTVVVEYGQPHARGRDIFGALQPYGEVWRLGANSATSLVTTVDLTIGTLQVPRGSYTLYMVPSDSAPALVVSRSTGQWGATYPEGQDLGRTPMRVRRMAEAVESLSIVLQPDAAGSRSGLLRIRWGNHEFSVDWSLRQGALMDTSIRN